MVFGREYSVNGTQPINDYLTGCWCTTAGQNFIWGRWCILNTVYKIYMEFQLRQL